MLKNIIVYDNNIVNICFKVKAKKDNGQMRAKRAENFRLRGGPKSRWGWTQNFGDGGDRSPWGGQPLDGGGSPPHPLPILGNPAAWETLQLHLTLRKEREKKLWNFP